ncbi:sugar phosphate isomerase/epimerase [Kibdelosporangium philippinense]|uniref:Sugar phosphate isomerase/epimerase n=1 Tax=Kibdelosporangium philippinense TaxID=211113 RepID=A0ABS8Z5R9_9PSEU|nr:sugar phosphate isomerase/epimerase family protein [Kibdelosporangium philippinense]MCE7003224.1 sugar phosphate isomerase/epimerase [Kibdelosporangium philippinense]
MTEWVLSGFGDEIDPDPVVQLAVLEAVGARHLELRGAWDTGVLELDSRQRSDLRKLLDERGLQVSAIASPLGKVSLDLPVEAELARLRTAIDVARAFSTRYIRMFSFYQEGRDPADMRDDVLVRLRAMTELAERADIVLLHENEKHIYGDTPARVLDLMETIGSDHLRVAWDSANFVQVGSRPFTDAYANLRPYLEYVQIKDALAADGRVVAAGEGDGEVVQTLTALRDDGYQGFMSLEPHLSAAHAPGDLSGPAAFGQAARALRRITDNLGVNLS